MPKAPAADTYEIAQSSPDNNALAFVMAVAILIVIMVGVFAYEHGLNQAQNYCRTSPGACVVHQPKVAP
jgi:hypothetical protein